MWTHRSTWSSYPPPPVSVSSVSGLSCVSSVSAPVIVTGGATLGQTILALLAGPALIAVMAAVVVLFVGTAHLPLRKWSAAAERPAAAAATAPATGIAKAPASATVVSAKSARAPVRARAMPTPTATDHASATMRTRGRPDAPK